MTYQFIDTDLVRLINPIGFGKEKYFFIFIDNFMRYTKVYTGGQNSDWF